MVDTKQTKTIGEHHVCAMLARYGWAPALTRDGISRTDILAVHDSGSQPMVAVQVKAMRAAGIKGTWVLGTNVQTLALSDREWVVLVAIDSDPTGPIRSFVVPRNHLAAAIHITHVHWATDPSVPPGKRNTPISQARFGPEAVGGYEERWDLLLDSAHKAPVLLPPEHRSLALEGRVGLPSGHPWNNDLPVW